MGNKYTFKREVEGAPIKAEGEILVSGSVVVTFDPPLPGRTKSISVDGNDVADLVRSMSCGVDFDPENECLGLTLLMVHKDYIEDNEDVQGYKTVTQMVPANVVVEMVVDQLVDPCPHCGKYQFGEDVQPSEAATGNDKPPKTYLN